MPSPMPSPTPTPSPTPSPAPTQSPAPTPPAAAPTPTPTHQPTATPAASTPPAPAADTARTATHEVTPRRIAIVNRLEAAAANAAAAFVTRLGLAPAEVIEPPATSSLAELDRLEGVRGADYALVLVPASELTGEQPGAQPALLDLAFLFGVLGRTRVCVLATGKAPAAPELDGLVPVHGLGDDLWQLLVARAMRKAGLEVDLNRVV